jgi:hypothetical protein
MPLDSTQTPYSPLPGGLADRARAAGQSVYLPHAKRGGSLRHEGEIPEKHDDDHPATVSSVDGLAQSTPPPRDRAKKTSADMAAFQAEWAFDWLAVTIPNGIDGKGSRCSGDRGDKEAAEATARMFTWATLKGLHVMRVGKGSDGYLGAAHMAYEPTATDRVLTIRAGHTTNMPGMELTGSDGACAELAPQALSELGPVNVSRVDVCWDVSQSGLMDDLHQLMVALAAERGMDAPRIDGTAERGRTIYLGKDEAVVRVYQKDLERVAKGRIAADDADPDLVRVEVMLRPKKEKKSGIGRTARDEGPGALLGVHLWVRQLMERVAVLTERAREDAAEMAVTRVQGRPDPRSLRDRAEHGTRQYARVWCLAEVAEIVHSRWGGDWLLAEIDPDEVLDRVVDEIKGHLRRVVRDTCERVGVLEAREIEEEAGRAGRMLGVWMDEHHRATTDAKRFLEQAAASARQACGVP